MAPLTMQKTIAAAMARAANWKAALGVVEGPGLVDAEEEGQEDGEALSPLAGARRSDQGANGGEYAGVGVFVHAGMIWARGWSGQRFLSLWPSWWS